MVPLSLFATARRHWAWLRGAIERHCQFSREARLHRVKKMKGLAPHPWAIILSPLASHTLKRMHVCAGGRGTFLPLPPRVPAICSPSCIMLA